MSELIIYDRFGDPVDADVSSEERYKMFDRKSVLLYLDTSSPRPTLISSFRAQNQPGSRSNRFLAHFTGDDIESLFKDCSHHIERRADELGWKLDTSSHDNRVNTFLGLTEPPIKLDSSEQKEQLISWLLEQQRRIDFGVSDVQFGIRVLKQLLRKGHTNSIFAICNNGRVPEINEADLVLKPSARGPEQLHPIGDTKKDLQEAREHWSQHFVEKEMKAITDAIVDRVQQIRRRTNYEEGKLNDDIKNAINQGCRQSGLPIRATTSETLSEVDELRSEVRRLKSRPKNDTSIPTAVPIFVVVLLVVAFVTGAVFSPPVAAVPILGEYLSSGNLTWTESPTYNSSTGTLSLSGTAPAQTEYVLVNVSNQSHTVSVPVTTAADGTFELSRQVNHLFEMEFAAIETEQYQVTVSAGKQQTRPEPVRIVPPASVILYEPIDGQRFDGSTFTIRGIATNSDSVVIAVSAGDQPVYTETLNSTVMDGGRFSKVITGLSKADNYTVTVTARRNQQEFDKQTVVLLGPGQSSTGDSRSQMAAEKRKSSETYPLHSDVSNRAFRGYN
ncbi:hypothetical protein SAMN04487948_11662 [Halogranum amylolyticum]|uniref:Uncharacterized protein n=1 Tax=Halogranum amylolyticum TaxID=660520 RepID=A0A1H8VG02_9EURY|nr:hypothetical protein [Halogranum amylolyticum]SEP14260.1 hypothetical protein SAMN04487948_11662 [Halogranum amylolyticum]